MSKIKMLNKTMTTILITLLTLPILLAVIPRASATMSAALCLPVSGPVGTTATITGTGASAGGLINVYWDNLGGAVLNSTAYANGAGGYSVMATIPTAGGGLHFLIVKDVSTGGTTGTAFTITPTLTLNPTSGIVGDTVSVTGTGYAASSNMSIFFGTPTVRLRQGGSSTATWYNDTSATSTPALMDVVKLVGATGSDARACVVIPANPANETLAAFAITQVSFKYNTTSALVKPDLELRFVAPNCIDPDDEVVTTTRGHVDITLTTGGTTAGIKTWETATYTAESIVDVFGNDEVDGTAFSYMGHTWTEALAWLPTHIGIGHSTVDLSTWNLTRISPQAGWTPIGTYYVDTVVYKTATYDLEPPINTTMSNALGSISTTFTVPTGATGEIRVSTINVTDLFANATFTVGPAITLSPTTGPAGTVVTVTGRGYDAGVELVAITVGGTSAPLNDTITKTTYGNFTGQFIVPTRAIGQNLDVQAVAADTEHAHATFNVTGNTATTLTPTTGVVGTVVTIEGANFTAIAGKTVTVTFNLISVATLSTNATGGFSGTFTVPSLTTGTFNVIATDSNTLTNTTLFIIAVTFLGISPVKGPTGTLATVTGYGFTTSGGTANVTIGTLRVLTNILDADLIIPSTITFYVPTLPVGNYTVTALDSGLLTASTNYEVNATTTVTLNSSSAIAGAKVALNASYFKAAQELTFTFKNATYTQALALTAATGYFTQATIAGLYNGTFTVPNLAIGSYTINATDSHNCTVEVPFSIVLAVPTITLNPTEQLIGAVVTVTGTTFRASTAVNIYFGSTLVRTVNSTSGGALEPSDANFTVPDVSYGTYTVTASDGVNSATATFNILSVHGIDTIQTIVTAIEAKLDTYGSFWNFTNTWFTTISNKLGVFTGTDTVAILLYDIKTSVSAINWTDITTIKSYVIDIKAKLDNTTYGLAAIKNAVDAINFTSIDNKLGTFTGTDTVAILLTDIKTSVSAINWTDITAIKAKTDTINWADITSIKSTTTLSIDYLWGLQDHPLWGLRTKVVPMLESIKNATQFTAGTYNTILPNSTAPVNLGKSSKVTLTVRATDDTTEGFVIKVYIYDGTAWRPLSFSVLGIASADCAATVEFTTGADGRLYFETTGATFTAFTYSAEFAP
jgi:hypothetical protein